MVSLMKEKKSEDIVDETKKETEKPDHWVGMDYRIAAKKPYFYGALFCIFITGMILQGLIGVAAPLMYDTGLHETYVAIVLSAHSLALTFCKFGVEFMYDHMGLRKTTNVCFVAAISATIMLACITNSFSGQIVAMVYGVISALALPLETVMITIYASDLFGEKSFNKILGVFVSVNVTGYALGAPLYNICYDLLGSYHIALYLSAALMAVVFVVMQIVIKSARKARSEM